MCQRWDPDRRGSDGQDTGRQAQWRRRRTPRVPPAEGAHGGLRTRPRLTPTLALTFLARPRAGLAPSPSLRTKLCWHAATPTVHEWPSAPCTPPGPQRLVPDSCRTALPPG